MSSSSTVSLTTNSDKLVINKTIVTENIQVNQLNVSDDIYLNDAIYTPVGSILTYAGASAPTGWLMCDGSEVSKTVYPRLFAVVGNTYGMPANGSNFVLPNLADRVPVGKSGSSSLGNTGGNSNITLSTSQLPSHTHTGTTAANGSHSHTGTTAENGTHGHSINDPGHTHTQTTINDDFNNSGINPPGFSADSAGSRTWSNISTSSTGITIVDGGSHSHTFTTATEASHSHTFTTDSTGSGQQIDIRNKFVVINYIIRV